MPGLTAEAPARAVGRYQLDTEVGRLAPAERAARGKEARARVPRDSHSVFDPPSDRPDPVALLAEQAQTRVPELVPVRWGRMWSPRSLTTAARPCRWPADLASDPGPGWPCRPAATRTCPTSASSARPNAACFDVNDFDETLPGPWEWDVKRLAASLEVAGATTSSRKQSRGRAGHGRSLPRGDARVRRHVATWTSGTPTPTSTECGRVRSELQAAAAQDLDKGLAKARTRDSIQALGQADQEMVAGDRGSTPTRRSWSRRRAAARRPDRENRGGAEEPDRGYQRTLRATAGTCWTSRFVDMARKVVGVGSVGTHCRIALLWDGTRVTPCSSRSSKPQRRCSGRDAVSPSTPTRASGSSSANSSPRPRATSSSGGRGGDRGRAQDFYVSQLRDMKGSAEVTKQVPRAASTQHCAGDAGPGARPLGRPHRRRRLPRRRDCSPAIASFAVAYADQNQLDYQALVDAAKSGRITAEHGL